MLKYNILVSKEEKPLIHSFILSRIGDHTNDKDIDEVPSGTTRWMSPELFLQDGKPVLHTKNSDIWAFGMAVYVSFIFSYPYKSC